MRLKLIVCSIFWSILAFSQIDQYKIYNINSEDGLLSDNVQSVYQDSYGFLWIASNDGIVRWDGYHFKKYIHSEEDLNTVSNNIIYTIFEDSKRNLWLGTINGLNLYNPLSDTFSKIKIDSLESNIPVNEIKEDSKHRLWLGTSDGLYLYDHNNPKNTKWYFSEPQNKTGLSDAVIFSMDIDKNDNIWIGTFNGGLNKFNSSTADFTRFEHRANDASSICSNKIKKLMVDHIGNIWVGSIDNGISVLNKKGQVIKHYKSFSNKSKQAVNSVTCIYQDKKNRLWIGLADQSLFYLDDKEDTFKPFINPVDKKYHITCHSINSIFEDSFGNTWFGSERDGLFYTNENKNNFKHYFYNYATSEGLSHNTVTVFCQDKNKNTWLGTNGGGLDYYNSKNNTITSYTKKAALKSLAIQDIKADASNKLWIATRNGGVTCFDPITSTSKTFTHDPLNKNSILFNDITSIIVDDTLIWMGTYGEGICIYNTVTKNFAHHKNNSSYAFDMRTPGWTNHLFKDSKDRIWIGSYGGLHCYNKKNNTFQSYRHSSDSNSISNHDINMIAEDAKGNIWVVTVAGGLELFQEKTKTFAHYSKLHNLPVTLKSIIVDNKGLLWMGSNSGIVCFNPLTKEHVLYGSTDGLQGDFFLHKSVSKNSAGELYFGGSNGFNVFHPEKINTKFKASNFYFTDLSVFGVLQKPNEIGAAIQKSLLLSDTLKIAYSQSFFTVEFTDINFYAPNKTQYRYKLEGLYDKWIDNKSERKISFTNLPAGSYTLKIKYTLPNGEWVNANKQLLIIVSPPWWKTWWFRLFIGTAIGIGLLMLYKLRVKNIQQRNEALEKEVQSRTLELSEKNKDLIESNEEIKLQKEKVEESNEEVIRQSDKILDQQEFILSQNKELEKLVSKLSVSDETKNLFFNILAHDLRGPVNAIGSLSDLLVNNIYNLSQKEILEFSTHIKQSSEATQKLLHNLLDWARTQSDFIEYSPIAVNASDLIAHNLKLFEQLCLQKNIQLSNKVNETHTFFVDYNMIDTVCRNLISNAIKFTPEHGKISIESSIQEDEIVLKISDTGLGITSTEIENLFLLGKRKSTLGTKGEKGTGLGLVIVKEFIEINKGHVEVRSKEQEGTVFIIHLPRAVEVVHAQTKLHLEEIISNKNELELPQFTEEQIQEVKGNRILLVEDNLAMRNHLKYLLASTFEIIEAENGQEALDKAAEVQPMVVITDMIMPVMDGLELCKALKNDRTTSHIPVIILTSQDTEESKLSGYYAGADIYLTKPVRKEILFQIVLNILQSREHLRQKLLGSSSEDTISQDLNAIDQEFLEHIKAFIEQHITDQRFEVQHIVRHVGISRSVLYAKFKAITGQGINEFIRLVRLRKSKTLLSTTNLSINEIAEEVGFNSASYFIRCFSKEYHCTPLEFRDRK